MGGVVDFFQGLLDNHSQILQFPGLLNNENIFQILTLKNSYEISNKFINTYPNFFNSKLSVQISERERHDRLGPKKKKILKVIKRKIKCYM